MELNTGFSSLCRACLKELGRRKYDLTSTLDLLQRFTLCTSLQVDKDDGFPTYLCEHCCNKLEAMYEFREMCINSMKKLEEMTVIPKKEVDIISDYYIFEEESKIDSSCLDSEENVQEITHIKKEVQEENLESQTYLLKIEKNKSDVLRNHEEVQSISKKSKIRNTCVKCNKFFYKPQRYLAHLREHEGLKSFICQKCGKEYSKSSGLATHVKRAHNNRGGTDIFACQFENCNKMYKTKDALRAHCKKVHIPNDGGKKNFLICEECGKALSTNAALKRHRFTHTGESPFKCDQCGKTYVSQHKLKEHCMRHNGIKNFVCPYCGLRKTTRNELNVHINYHTREKVHTCELCFASFSHIGNVKRHINVVHKGIKAYPCRFCERSFGKAETLKHHEMTHTGERPHECNKCGKRFIQLVALQTHLNRHMKSMAMGD